MDDLGLGEFGMRVDVGGNMHLCLDLCLSVSLCLSLSLRVRNVSGGAGCKLSRAGASFGRMPRLSAAHALVGGDVTTPGMLSHRRC